MDDPRFRMLSGSLLDPKKQLIASLEPLEILPRGSAGTTLPTGATTVSFDIPDDAVLVITPHDRIEITCMFQKSTDNGVNWAKVDAADAKDFLVTPYFAAHIFSAIKFMCANKHAKTDGFIEHGLGMFSDFVLAHTRKDVRAANFSFDELDPANFSFLTRAEWALQTGATDGDYKKILGKWGVTTEGVFRVSYKPLCFPFYLHAGMPPYGPQPYVIPPMPNVKYSIDFDLDVPYNNCLSVKAGLPAGSIFRLKVDSMTLFLTQARMTALGEKAIREKQKAQLLRYPGSTVVQNTVYLKGEQGGSWVYDDVVLPSHILIQAFEPAMLTTGDAPNSKRRTLALEHRIGEVTVRYENRDFYLNRTSNQFSDNKTAKMLRRREFCHYPFFDMPVNSKMFAGDIADYAHSHILLTMLSNPLTGEKMKTIGQVPDPERGKLTINLKCSDATQGFHPMYVVTFYYRGEGIYLDRQNRTFTSSVLKV